MPESVTLLSTDLRANCFSNDETRAETCSQIDLDLAAMVDAITRLNTRRNSVVPIGRLPPEILGMVFVHLRGFWKHSLLWIEVSWVCTYWRQAALDCHALWTNLSTTGTHVLQRMTTFIARSGSLPVNINIKLSHKERASEDLWTVLLGQQYRTKRLEIHDDRRSDTLSHRHRQEPLNLISKLRSTPAPILESLTINMALRSNSHLPPPLCADLPTCLKTISLFGCTMPTTMIIPDSLQSLTLSHTVKESPPGLRHLLMVLQRACHIKTLDLSFAAKFTTEDDSSAPVVYMPHLERLKITFDTLRHHYIAYLHIIHPASTKVELEFRKASRDPINPYPPYVDGIRALGGVIAQRFSGSLRRLRISASTRNVSHILRFYDHDDNPKPSTKPCLKMQIFYAEPYKCKILSAFCEGLEMKYVKHLSLSDTSKKATDLQLCMPIFGQWPSLSTIVYYGNPTQLAVAMTADVKVADREGSEISHANGMASEGDRVWGFASLKTLIIEGWLFNKKIVETLREALQMWWDNDRGLEKLCMVKCTFSGTEVELEDVRNAFSVVVRELEWDDVKMRNL